MTAPKFLVGSLVVVAITGLLNLLVDRLKPRKPIIPDWVAGLRFQAGRRVLPQDVERFGAMLESRPGAQDREHSVVVQFPSTVSSRARMTANKDTMDHERPEKPQLPESL